MPPPSAWERVALAAPGGGTVLPPWGTLVLEGAARSWMIAAIVWGSVVFVAQDVTQSIVQGNHHHTSGLHLGAHRGPAAPPEERSGTA